MVGILSRPADPKRRDVLETCTADRTSESTARYQDLRSRVVGAAANDPRRFLVRGGFSEAPVRHKKWTSPENGRQTSHQTLPDSTRRLPGYVPVLFA